MNFGSGMAVGMATGMLLQQALEEAEPIDFKCENCGHSWKKHKNGKCEKGIFNKCVCTHFKLRKDEVKEAEKELKELREIMFEDYEKALSKENER